MSRKLLGKDVWTQLDEMLNPEHTALLVVDVQNDFCSPGGALAERGGDVSQAQAILEPLQRLIESGRDYGVQIVDILITLFEDARTNSSADLARRVAVWDDHPLATLDGTWGHANPDGLHFDSLDWVVKKYRNNAFLGTNLDLLLRSAGIRTVVVAGTATHACVLETCLSAQGLDYYVIVPTDCVASGSEELHQAGLSVMKAVLHKEGLTSSEQVQRHWMKFAR